jgi:hypothetical protein
MGADDKIVQRVLRNAKLHVTRERSLDQSIRTANAGGDEMQATLKELFSGQ